ncbi:MAG: 3-dehydroquinate synthase [Pseudomonadales bacterium]
METVNVELGARSYPIHIGTGLIGRTDLFAPHLPGNKVAIVTNTTVGPLYADRLLAALPAHCASDVIELPDGETFKTLAEWQQILEVLLRRRYNRSSTLIALGGGVIGDLTGFAAACFQRGIEFIQVPTTLLAQVDSSVGGKTGVNHALGKNMIGAFHQPRAVIADIDLFATLPTREFSAGLAEVAKYGVIRDAAFFAWLEDNAAALCERDEHALQHAIRRSCEIKAEVVAADERESDLRAILNYGHTFGHALETLTGYATLLHGEAVAIGMIQAADLSARIGLMDTESAQRIKALVAALGLPVAPPALSPDEMIDAMGADKKAVNGRLRLVLATRIGQVMTTEEIDGQALFDTLKAGERLCR